MSKIIMRFLQGRQRISWQLIGESCKHEAGRRDIFWELLSPVLAKNRILLDAGCGRGKGAGADYKHYVRLAIGVDLSLQDLSRNSTLHNTVQGDVQVMPFADRV